MIGSGLSNIYYAYVSKDTLHYHMNTVLNDDMRSMFGIIIKLTKAQKNENMGDGYWSETSNNGKHRWIWHADSFEWIVPEAKYLLTLLEQLDED